MKFTLECDDEKEFLAFLNGPKLQSAVWDTLQEMRKVAKYSEDETEANYAAHWCQVLSEKLEDRSVNLFE